MLTLPIPRAGSSGLGVCCVDATNPAGRIGNALAFFICGLPGGIDYGSECRGIQTAAVRWVGF